MLLYIGARPYLRIDKGPQFEGNPGEYDQPVFGVRYINQGELPAEDVVITDTMVGMTFVGDNSGLPVTVEPGNQEVSWDLGTVEPGDWITFEVFADIIASVGEYVSNTVEISTSNSYDQGGPEEKISTWEGEVAPNDTHLNVGKWPWTEHPAPDQDFVYTVNVCNDGSTGSSPVTLTDTLPDPTNFVHWWSDDGGWAEIDLSGNPVVFEHAGIPSHSCSEVYIVAQVDGGAIPGDELVNLAEIAATNDLETEDNITEYYHEAVSYTHLTLPTN